MFTRTFGYTCAFFALLGCLQSGANAQMPSATPTLTPPTAPASTPPTGTVAPVTTTATAPGGIIPTSATVTCTAKPTALQNLLGVKPPNQTQIYNVTWDLNKILDCFLDKALATTYLEYLLDEFYNDQIPPMINGSGFTFVSCTVCYKLDPGGSTTPPNYQNFCTVVNNLYPIVDPSLLFSDAELACADAALQTLGGAAK